MRIVLDLQGAQTESRTRGIGRYSLSLARAIARNRGGHHVFVVLSDLFPETVERLRAAFDGLLPQENIRLWHAPGPVSDRGPVNRWRRECAQKLREAFLASLAPDVVHVLSLFEGFYDDAVTSVGDFAPDLRTAVTLYDLIPYIHPQAYLDRPEAAAWYYRKLDHLRRADLWLAISESSRREGIEHLGLPEDAVVNVSAAADERFRPLRITAERERELRMTYGLSRPFVMHTAGIEYHKNIDGIVRAFGRLPPVLRKEHQLAIVCTASPEGSAALRRLASQAGLGPDELVITGFVPDEELVELYNLCKLFVFPSLHEGFGLPALEAMRCSAPVIGSNTSSLPEVIGREDALFDPASWDSIAAKMAQALTDKSFRAELVRHGKRQGRRFSWDESAKRAIAAFEAFHASQPRERPRFSVCSVRRPRLAYVVPLPSPHNPVVEYSSRLLPELARHYEVELVGACDEMASAWVSACCPVRSTEWFLQHADRYPRILYHFGGSRPLRHMLELLERVPGVIVLHDFFLGEALVCRDGSGVPELPWPEELYLSHGYGAVFDYFHAEDCAKALRNYPCNFSVLRRALGVIVPDAQALRLAGQWYGPKISKDWAWIPFPCTPHGKECREEARAQLGLSADEFVVCCFSGPGSEEVRRQVLDAWFASRLADDTCCRLIFVGHEGADLIEKNFGEADLNRSGNERIRVVGWVSARSYWNHLCAADLVVNVQASVEEGRCSSVLRDCMSHGLPIIVTGDYGLKDFPADAFLKLPASFDSRDLVEALDTLYRSPDRRSDMSLRARNSVLVRFGPRNCADDYANNMERFYAERRADHRSIARAVAETEGAPREENEWARLAASIGRSLPLMQPARQLLVDVSELAQRDSKTGIQRVVRALLSELLRDPPPGFRVEPVFAVRGEPGYRYAKRFTSRFLGFPVDDTIDSPMEAGPGDLFLGLDLQSTIVPEQEPALAELRRYGVGVYFVVYDLIPALMPHMFPPGWGPVHEKWMRVIARFDGAFCISRSVAEEFAVWLRESGVEHERPYRIDWFHLGADLDNSAPTYGIPVDGHEVLRQLSARPSFLMVGTVEPRKGHAQALAAFERLWDTGCEANLVIVGKQGWMVDSLVQRLQDHPERGRRLFWQDDTSDEYLEKIYGASACLLAASQAEGFGLPLIEAARYALPVLARDIPVFREIAGDHAHYFQGMDPGALVSAIREWLLLREADCHPRTEAMPWLTWRESAAQLRQCIFRDGEATNASQSSGDRDKESEMRLTPLEGGESGAPADAPVRWIA